ncbi:Inner membrane protein YdjM [Candidatus Providencia siddallii]|uniref:Inner membrane protein YdjM n=1 Tax=Candidatus Providencia siddallii TaxID=1715285 RepID=A0A0M6W9W1_9GAMM|nr:Inner membrane protein YdjM [Candidatus Providencia siddallii]
MTAEGHMLFSIASLILAKKLELTTYIVHGNLTYMILAVLFGSLLPDIDHTSSVIGRLLFFLSFLISKVFRHRGFTHSFLAWIILTVFCYNLLYFDVNIDMDLLQSFLLGYISHEIADMLTPRGVQFFWPLQKHFCLSIFYGKTNKHKERFIFIILIICAYIIPLNYKINYFFQIKDLIRYINTTVYIESIKMIKILCDIINYVKI